MNLSDKIKLRWLNPLALPYYDEPMGQMMAEIKNNRTHVEVVSLEMEAGMDNLEYRFYESLIWGATAQVAYDADQSDVDVMVIGCFYDPALEDCREICKNTIVVAPCQASMHIASNVANKFSVIVGQVKWIEQMTERAFRYGYRDYLASMRSVDIAVSSLQADVTYTTEKIIEQGRKAIEEDRAEALILGCTCNFGMYKEVQDELGVPVIDPILAAFKTAEHLAFMKKDFGLMQSNIWSSEAPPASDLEKFGLSRLPIPIGNKLTF